MRGTSEIWNPLSGAVPPLLSTARWGVAEQKRGDVHVGSTGTQPRRRLAWPLTRCLTLGPFSLHLSSLYPTRGGGAQW